MEIPKTRSGKIVELLVKKIINGENIENTEMITNPHCLKEYQDIYNLISYMPKRIVVQKTGGPEVLKYDEYKLPKNFQNQWFELNKLLLVLILLIHIIELEFIHFPLEFPFCPGLEAAGNIIEVGDAVKGI